MFDNYFISGDALLNKNGDVTPEGQYVSPIKDNNLRMGERRVQQYLVLFGPAVSFPDLSSWFCMHGSLKEPYHL